MVLRRSSGPVLAKSSRNCCCCRKCLRFPHFVPDFSSPLSPRCSHFGPAVHGCGLAKRDCFLGRLFHTAVRRSIIPPRRDGRGRRRLDKRTGWLHLVRAILATWHGTLTHASVHCRVCVGRAAHRAVYVCPGAPLKGSRKGPAIGALPSVRQGSPVTH